jgi:hypothetical protein
MSKQTLNDHLNPVFGFLLPALERAGIDYWVFGGVAVAGCIGQFIRFNKDVDVMVKRDDYETAERILRAISNDMGFALRVLEPTQPGRRGKFEIYIDGQERMSVMPILVDDDGVILQFGRKQHRYPREAFEKTPALVQGAEFFTPTRNGIRLIFHDHLRSRSDKKTRPSIVEDARVLLTEAEAQALGVDLQLPEIG